jgi:preprotein translocase subunit SecG
MYTVIVILILLVCLFLAAAVLVQNSKGGGLAANFSAPNQIMGVRKTTETIEKITWGLAIALAVLSLIATISIPRHTVETEISTEVDVNATKSVAPVTAEAPLATDVAPAPEAE